MWQQNAMDWFTGRRGRRPLQNRIGFWCEQTPRNVLVQILRDAVGIDAVTKCRCVARHFAIATNHEYAYRISSGRDRPVFVKTNLFLYLPHAGFFTGIHTATK